MKPCAACRKPVANPEDHLCRACVLEMLKRMNREPDAQRGRKALPEFLSGADFGKFFNRRKVSE